MVAKKQTDTREAFQTWPRSGSECGGCGSVSDRGKERQRGSAKQLVELLPPIDRK